MSPTISAVSPKKPNTMKGELMVTEPINLEDDDPMGLSTDWEMKKTAAVEDGVVEIEVDDVDLDEEVKFEPKKVDVARTLSEFQNMIAIAHMGGAREIEASKDVFKYLLKGGYNPNDGHMIYQDVYVYEEGRSSEVKVRLSRTLEEAVFGHSKVTIADVVGK